MCRVKLKLNKYKCLHIRGFSFLIQISICFGIFLKFYIFCWQGKVKASIRLKTAITINFLNIFPAKDKSFGNTRQNVSQNKCKSFKVFFRFKNKIKYLDFAQGLCWKLYHSGRRSHFQRKNQNRRKIVLDECRLVHGRLQRLWIVDCLSGLAGKSSFDNRPLHRIVYRTGFTFFDLST